MRVLLFAQMYSENGSRYYDRNDVYGIIIIRTLYESDTLETPAVMESVFAV